MTSSKRFLTVTFACLAAGLAVACGITAEPGSGETHFLVSCNASCAEGLSCLCGVCTRACDAASSCEDLGASATCLTAPEACGNAPRICDVSCTSAANCAALGTDYACASGVCRKAPPQAACPSGCFAVLGFPEDPELHCATLDQPTALGCQCTAAFGSYCRRRVSDGKLFVAPDGEFEDPSAWLPCTAEESTRFRASCDFAACENPPASYCTLEQTCSSRGCDTPQYDAVGCLKTECMDDSACASDERCVELQVIDLSACSQGSDGACNCGGANIALPGAFCNATAEFGPRGAWQSLLLTEDNGLCVPGACYKSWNVMPDGMMFTQKAGVAAMVQLSAEQLSTLEYLIDGPELRRDLRDHDCGTVEDGVATLSLTLENQVLDRDIAGCLYSGYDGAIPQVYDFLQGF